MAQINFGILDTKAPGNIVDSFRQGQDIARQNKLSELAMRKADMEMADDEATRQAYKDSAGDQNKLLSILQGNGQYKAADSVRKQQLEAQAKQATIGKDTATANEKNYNVSQAKKEKAIQDILAFNSVEEAKANLQQHVQAGDIPAEHAQLVLQGMPSDPLKFNEWKVGMVRNIMAPKDQVTAAQRDAELKQQRENALRVDERIRSEGALSRGVQIRGQNMTDSRARESLNQGKVPSGYRAMPDGSLQAIPGGPADPKNQHDKPLTEAQGNALVYSERMRASEKVLNEQAKKGTLRPGGIKTGVEETLGAVPIIGGALASAGAAATNWTQSAGQQQVEQAQRDFINATLRRESGAAISPGEFDSARKQYFPSLGDSQAVLEQKAKNRALAIRGIAASVPSQTLGRFQSEAPQQPAPQQGNSVKFLGFE